MSEDIKSNFRRRETWVRLFFMVLFALIYGVAELVLVAVVALQFGFVLLTTRSNQNLLAFGAGLSQFIYRVLLFLTYNSDEMPFPFSEWPAPPPAGRAARARKKRPARKPAAD